MRTTQNIATIVAGLFLAAQLSHPSYGQAHREPGRQASRSSGSPVAVADISYIFKNHDRFKQSMERMKQEVRAIEEKLKSRHQEIDSLRSKLNQFRPGTTEYKTTEADIAQRQASLQADTQIKRKDFLEKEAQVYYDIYMDVAAEIKAFADNHGIGLVLRFSGDKIDPTNRASVLQGVNRPVVYQRNLNITYDILDRLKRRTAQQSAQAPARATPSASRRR